MRKRTIVWGLAAMAFALAACGDTDGDGDLDADPLKAAQQAVARAEADLEAADEALTEARSTFCEEAGEYLQSVDRYGKLVDDTAATVGDVTTAGQDLERPRDQAIDSGEDLQAAHDAQAAATQALADAEATLAEVESGTSAPETTTTTAPPLVAEATVARATQAESDLAAAFDGVEGSTPLAEAGQQVNAAAVAVQVAWMQLAVDAGCLSDEQQAEAITAVADYTRSLQAALTAAGHYSGELDGVYGAETVAAVEALQTAADLPVTGLVDQATAEALDAAVEAAGGDAAAEELAHTAALQTVLTLTGHWTGPIDGVWTDALTAALQALQTELGVEPTGVVDPATIAAVQGAVADAQAPEETTTTAADEETTTTSTTAG